MLQRLNNLFISKNAWVYSIIIILCIACYLISKSFIEKKYIEKEIIYSSNSASEVYMAWIFLDGHLPSKEFWPQNSYFKDEMVYTKLTESNGKFITSLKLPVGSDVNYWMVQRKGKAGNETDVWDTGGVNQRSYTLHYEDSEIFKPGYFIFLAGFIPLLLLYFNRKTTPVEIKYEQKFRLKNYIPQFDSIRAIAVLLVIFHHWLPKKSIINFLPNGPLGVNIFFVLSGFLITGILLKDKKQSEDSGLNKTSIFKNFYIRRTLRIFPIYYLLLIILWFLNDPDIKEHGCYYFTYTSNILFYSQQFFPTRLSHLWSLAVEEQFYILWPWLIILVNKKFLPYLISLFIVIGISSNYIFVNKNWWVAIFTPACFDAFAIGGILSWLTLYRQDVIALIQPKFKWIFSIVIVLFLLDVFNLSFLPRRTSHALLAVTIIYYCLFKNNNTIMNFILNNKWLMWIGKISYGVYLYHLFVPELWMWIIKKFTLWNIDLFFNKAMPALIKPWWLFIQEFSFLMLICFVSWKLIEKPINNLKRKFENKPLNKGASEIENAPANTFSY